MAFIFKKNSSPYYYVRYTLNGKVIDYSTKSRNQEVSKRIRNAIEDRLALGKLDMIPVSDNLTVERWYKEFIDVKENEDLTYGSIDRYTRNLDNFLSFCKDVRLMRQFTSQHITNYITKRRGEIGGWALQNEMITIKSFFNKCGELHRIPSPAKNISVSEPQRKEPNIYTQEEVREMLQAKNIRDKGIVMLDLQAGLRKAEMGSRRWKHIDWERNSIAVRAEDGFVPKDKDPRKIPMRPETKEALLEWKKVSKYNKEEDFIFPNTKGKEFIVKIKNKKTGKTYLRSNFDKSMSGVLKKIGIKGHCQKFRDSAASYWLACGVPPQNVRDWLGHSDIKITDHYANYMPKAIEIDIRKLFEWR